QPGARWQPLLGYGRVPPDRRGAYPGRGAQLVVLPEALPDRTLSVQHRLGAPGEVLSGPVAARLDVANVRRIEAHRDGELVFGHATLDTPPNELGDERIRGPLRGRVARGHAPPARHYE